MINPTTRDNSIIRPTRLDGAIAETRRDGSSRENTSSVQLPPSLVSRFRIVHRIAAVSGEADLVIADEIVSNVSVVIKLYRPGISPKVEVLEKLAKLSDTQIIRVLENGQADGLWFEVQEFAKHGSLRDLLGKGPLTDKQVRVVVTQLNKALVTLHQQGIIHRDLKPDNILIRNLDPIDLAVTDFGISSIFEGSKHFTSASRTIRYGAPETISGVVSNAADFWSLGMVVVECLTGRPPFSELSDEVVIRHLMTQSVPLDHIAEPWLILCRGLLLRDPKQRWTTVEIERWLNNDTTLLVVEDIAPGFHNSFLFKTEKYWTRQELAAALITDWSEAIKRMQRGDIAKWVRDEVHDIDLTRRLDDLAEDAIITGKIKLSSDQKLCAMLALLAPTMPVAWKGYFLDQTGIELLARASLENNDNNASQLLISLFNTPEILPKEVQNFLPQNWQMSFSIYLEIIKNWKSSIEVLDQLRLKYQSHLAYTKEKWPSSPMVELLLGNLSSNYLKNVRDKILHQIPQESYECNWFVALGPLEMPHLQMMMRLWKLASADAKRSHFSRSVKPGEIFRDDDLAPELVVVPLMPNAQKFAIGRFPVTVGEFRAFIEATDYLMEMDDWRYPGFLQDDRHPVVFVTIKDAIAYTNWLSKHTRSIYRLPSVVEWQYIARGNSKSQYWWGDGTNYEKANAYWDGRVAIGTTTVSTRTANSFGVCETLGNVWEWTQDRDTNGNIVVGGAWDLPEKELGLEKKSVAKYGSSNLGFRVLRELMN